MVFNGSRPLTHSQGNIILSGGKEIVRMFCKANKYFKILILYIVCGFLNCLAWKVQ